MNQKQKLSFLGVLGAFLFIPIIFNQGAAGCKRSIPWIEQLLQRSLPEHRKYCIWRIVAPYFINVKHLSFDDSYDKIYQWLEKCNELKVLDFDPETKINDCLSRAANTGYLPISFHNPLREPRTLKTDKRELYDILKG